MRITQKRIEASRANGARSKGPVTDEGKRRSAINAMRHGMLARCIVLGNESQETFDALLHQHLDKLNPADGIEHAAVEEMAASMWRLRRLWAIETKLLNEAIENRTDDTEAGRLAGAFSKLSAGSELSLIDRYESRLHRMYQRSLANLLTLREAGEPELMRELEAEAEAQNEGPRNRTLLQNEPECE